MSTLSLTWLVVGHARGGRPRLIGVVAGVAVGVALLLLIVGAYNGLTSRTERSTWTYLSTGVAAATSPGHSPVSLADDEVLAASTSVTGTGADLFEGRAITRVDIAASPTSTVEVPGVGAPPQPGEYYASPALAVLIAAHPADQLGNRYGVQVGLIADDALASPDSLVVVVGTQQERLAPLPEVVRLTYFRGFAYPTGTYRVAAIVGAIAVLFPVIVLIGIVTRLGQAERRDRFAALRLMGATPHRVAVVSGIETGVASLIGGTVGVALFWLLVPVAALVPVEDGRFFVADLHVGVLVAGLVAVGTALTAATVAYVIARSADVGPLGASREARERAPRIASIVPLLAGVAVLLAAATTSAAGVSTPRLDAVLLVGGFVVVAVGLLLAGPVLTAWVSSLGVRVARGAAGVLAMNRIRRHPRATFRAVSGLVLAVFVVSVFAAVITTARTESVVAAAVDERIPPTALVGHVNYVTAIPSRTELAAQTAKVTAARGVIDVIIATSDPTDGLILPAASAARLGLHPPVGADLVRVDSLYFTNTPVVRPVTVDAVPATRAVDTWPASVIVITDGTADALERARTALISSDLPLWTTPTTRAEDAASGPQTWVGRYARLADIGILIATVVSAVSLGVSTVAGLLDRRRVLGLLRLTGMLPSTLRRMLTAEAALPIVTVFALCIALGFLVAWTLLTGLTQGRRTISWPDPDYYLTLTISLALAAVAIVATFRTARQSTSISSTRFE